MAYSIVFVTAQDISEGTGAGIATLEIIQAFAAHPEISLILVAPEPRGNLPSELLANIDRIEFMPQKPESPTLLTHIRTSVNGFSGMHGAFAGEQPDAIVARMHHTLLAPAVYARRYDTPYFLLARGSGYKRLRFSRVLTQIFRFNVQIAEEVYAASDEIQDDADRFRNTNQSQTQIMANAVNPELFTPRPRCAAREELELDFGKEDFVIGFVGTMRRIHALRELVEALAHVRNPGRIKLLLIGDGDDRAPTEKLASELGFEENVVFTGLVKHDTVPDYIAACDITFGAVKMESATPIKCFEYMAAGRPVIVNDMAEMTFVAEQNLGATILTVTPESIAEAIEMLSQLDQTERVAMGDRARKYVLNNHTWQSAAETVVSDLVALLAQ